MYDTNDIYDNDEVPQNDDQDEGRWLGCIVAFAVVILLVIGASIIIYANMP